MVLTGSIRRSPEEWLPFLLGRESLCPWCSLSSRSLWSVLSLSCWGHWGHWFRSHADGTAYLKASTQRWKCSADMLGEEMALPRGCCIKEGGARGCQGNRVSVLRSQLLLWKSYQLGHQLPLFPLQIFGFVTEKNFLTEWLGKGVYEVTTYVPGKEDSEWACCFAPALLGLGFIQISRRGLYPWLAYQMCRKLFPSWSFQSLFPSWWCVEKSPWDVCNLFLEMRENHLVIFITEARMRPASSLLWFWFFQAEVSLSFDKTVRRSIFRGKKKKGLMFSPRQFSCGKYLYSVFGNKKSNHCYKATVICE